LDNYVAFLDNYVALSRNAFFCCCEALRKMLCILG
jgi:hypothetical protein